MKPKALVIRTAGTNCDKETHFALTQAGAQCDLAHVNFLKTNRTLSQYQILCIPGGFSYGDDLGAGKIFSLELTLWFQNALVSFLDEGGLILGICNGFQVLVKAGILPDVDFTQKVTLTNNDSGRFEDRWMHLAVEQANAAFCDIWCKDMPLIVDFPVAHAEGKFYADKAILDRIEKNNQVAFRYVTKDGQKSSYPDNPNGSLHDIAGITDATGRVLGLMPHPERCIFMHHHPDHHIARQEPWGLAIFKNAVNYCKNKKKTHEVKNV